MSVRVGRRRAGGRARGSRLGESGTRGVGVSSSNRLIERTAHRHLFRVWQDSRTDLQASRRDASTGIGSVTHVDQ